MEKAILTHKPIPTVITYFGNLLRLAVPLFLIELLTYLLLKPTEAWALPFGALWAILLSGILLLIPKTISRIVYGLIYGTMMAWGIAQAGYYFVFGKMMWLSTISFAGEGAAFFGDILSAFPPLWWVGSCLLLILGVLTVWRFPGTLTKLSLRCLYVIPAILSTVTLFLLPEAIFQRDNDVWGTHSEYGQANSYRAMYETMYDPGKLYNICGLYQMTFRDVWMHEIYPLTPGYLVSQAKDISSIDDYFAERGATQDNQMTGVLAGKNVVLVLMESMDDWMITEADTPTLYQLMEEGIVFTDFYTPGYGSARTINSEFCMNTGIYLPTSGSYLFDYITNDWSQSIASQLTDNGYSAEIFHYNTPDFYSRGVLEPAMGYDGYNCYEDYETDKDRLYDDCLLFDIPQLRDTFFREGQTFNTIITRSAHLSYVYNEVLSHYALKQYPQYRGLYGSEEEDCARVKARLVDDMFAQLIAELAARDQLENTVIIGMTDHYTYGYKNTDELFALSGVDHELLLEKTPCFIWSYDGPDLEVSKTLNTSDLLPTVLNLLGIESPYHYLGQDAFDPEYVGYAVFPDGSWASEGVFCRMSGSSYEVILNKENKELPEEYLQTMSVNAQKYIRISNLLLTSDYYKEIR